MVSISPSEVPKILQLPPLDLSLSTATLSFRILIPTYSLFYSFIHRLFFWEERGHKILSKYCCIINHTSQLFSGTLFTWHVLINYYLAGTVLGPGDPHINKTWLLREDKRGLNKVWRKLKEKTITCAYGKYHKKVHIVGLVRWMGDSQADHG